MPGEGETGSAGMPAVPTEDSLQSFKVVELQQMLRNEGESAKGTKSDLVKRLHEKLKKKAEDAKAEDIPITMKPLPAAKSADSLEPVKAREQNETAESLESGSAAKGEQNHKESAQSDSKDDSGQDKGRKRLISVRPGSDSASKSADAGSDDKRRKAEGGRVAVTVGGSTSAVTNDSIQALSDELGVGRQAPVQERRTQPLWGSKNASNNAPVGGSRIRQDPYGGLTREAAGARANVASAPRVDGVRGRGANMFAAVTAERQEREQPPEQQFEKFLKLEGLKRPFTDKQLREYLEEHGQIVWIWLNRIKSICLVEFATEQQANNVRNNIYDLQWPPKTGSRIKASFLKKSEAELIAAAEPAAKPLGARLGVFPPKAPAPMRMDELRAEPAQQRAPPQRARWQPDQNTTQYGDEEPKSLEDLFVKTKAKPEIYWVSNKPEVKLVKLNRLRGIRIPPPPPPPLQ